MNLHKTTALTILLLAGSSTFGESTLMLSATDAVVSPTNIKKDRDLVDWKQGGTAAWTFELAAPITNQNILVTYAAPIDCTMNFIAAGRTTATPLKQTDGWDDFRTALAGTLTLPAGSHELIITNTNPGTYINLRHLAITPDNPPPFTYEYPSLYTQCTSWAESMVFMRTAFRAPEVQQAQYHYGKQLDLYLNESDGKALWKDFPKETDWFLQDNQVHGEWGRGKYDARQDFEHYLQPDRDSTLEQQLIQTVLDELGTKARPFSKKLKRLVRSNTSPDNPAWLELYTRACRARRQQRLQPLQKKTDQLVYATHMNMGTIYLATETQGCPDGSQLRLIDLSPEKKGKPLKDELLFDSNNGIVRDPELSFDGKKLLFAWRKTNRAMNTIGKLAPETGNYKIYEMDLVTGAIRPLTTDETYGADFEPCYLPDGNIMFSSSRVVHEVTCGWGDCSNLFIMDKDGNYARRVGFDQTQTGFPHLLNDGRVVYTRRDYNDKGQSYGHALFVMNADGTSQTEYYGNNDFAPTSLQHTRPIPGTRKTMSIAGGYHTSQGGKLVVIDPSQGRQNYDGLTFLNWEPTPLDQINNENYCRIGEQYAYPYPFDEHSFLVSFDPVGSYLFNDRGGVIPNRKEQGRLLYKLYYMTMDGRRELLASHPTLSCTQAIPLMPRQQPPVRASSVDYTKTNGICYVQNVYYGPSTEGIEPGTVKKLRVVRLYYKPVTIGAGGYSAPRNQVGPGKKYGGYGWHSVLPTGVGSASWDTKKILGEVDVHPDGSAMFEVPARTPIYFQLVDENGLVVQTMRSWATLMPNERFSCVGCHEENDAAPLPQAHKTMAMQRAPQKLQPVHNISDAPFSYAKMVQPIWNQHCVSCHAPGQKAEQIDLTDTIVSDDPAERGNSSTRRKFYQSYLTLLKVDWRKGRPGHENKLDEGRPNEWVNYYTRLATVELTPPYYAGSTQSGLIKLLQEGHEKTRLSNEEIGTVAAWIDLSVPFVGEYDEMNIWDEKSAALYLKKLTVRHEQEAIEQENIRRYVEAGQPRE
jgi:hypothetical protein